MNILREIRDIFSRKNNKKKTTHQCSSFNATVLNGVVPTRIHSRHDEKRFIVAPSSIWANPNAKRAKPIRLDKSRFESLHDEQQPVTINNKHSHGISDAESVMSQFMEKLENGTFKKDTEPHSNGVPLDETFIEQQVESYGQLLQSGIMDQAIESEKGHTKTKS